MTKSAMIRARVDPGLKKKTETLLQKLGLNATEAITLFYRQVLLQRGLPFEVTLPQEAPSSHISGESRSALIEKARSMTPDERLEAFVNHAQLLSEIAGRGRTRAG